MHIQFVLLHLIFCSRTLSTFDYFAQQKQNGLLTSMETIRLVVEHVSAFNAAASSADDAQLGTFLGKLLKLSLWGNRCDLSVSLGRQIQQSGDAFTALESLDTYLLVDRCPAIVTALQSARHAPNTTVDFVLDNSGYELFTDLVLAHYLLQHGYATHVRFHVKAIPWFISDVMPADFDWTLDTLAAHPDAHVARFGRELCAHRDAGRIAVRPLEFFWTGPWEFYRMAAERPALYADLAAAHLVVFKGDLNYRKLLGDFNWPYGETFERVLRGEC